jgi:predicted TIM-barrel fold metal-dependent hydrolase
MFDDLTIVDADTHLTEPHDLWAARAPKGWEDRVPVVREIDGDPTWIMGDIRLGRAGASGVVGTDGRKVPALTVFTWRIEDVHPGAHSVNERLEMMDAQGIWAQIVYPNTIGFGGQRFAQVADPEARILVARIYNDAMAELQEASGQRLFPMGILPWWDVDLAVAEIARMDELGLRGVNTTAAPHDHGLADLADPCWDPVWEAASDLGLPVNFHIGSSDSAVEWYGRMPWPSLGPDQKLGIGSAMLYLNNAAVLANLIYSGVLERFPTLQVVSVESGVGWIPFLLRALDHQITEMAPDAMDYLSMAPSEYFRRQIHSCFWFERQGIDEALEALGSQHLMFETDFPHPTCTFPDGLDYAAAALADVSETVRRDVMGANAARLYRLPLPSA